MNFGEDFHFFAACAGVNKKLALVNDTEGIVLHVLHRHNTAKIFPQYLLPPFIGRARFPGAAVERVAICRSAGGVEGKVIDPAFNARERDCLSQLQRAAINRCDPKTERNGGRAAPKTAAHLAAGVVTPDSPVTSSAPLTALAKSFAAPRPQ